MDNFCNSAPPSNRGLEDTTYPILVDWITLSGTFHSFDEMITFLGLNNAGLSFVETNPKWFFKSAVTYNNEITLMLSQKDDVYFGCINITGRGCRDIDSFSEWSCEDLLCIAKHRNYSVSRLDLAMDIIDDDFSISRLVKDTKNHNFKCRSKFYNIMESCDDGLKGCSLYFGKQNSNLFINIYDKRAERGYQPDEMPNWTRIEMRFRHENSNGLVKLLECNSNIGYLFSTMLNNYLTFLKPNKKDSNKSRWDIAPYWQRLLLTAESTTCLTKKGVEYDYGKFEDYLFNTCGSTIVTYLQNHSLDELKDELSYRGVKMNDRQKILVNNYQEGIVWCEL